MSSHGCRARQRQRSRVSISASRCVTCAIRTMNLREHDGQEEHPGGGRFNHLLLVVVVGIAMVVGVVAIEGIRSAGVSTPSTSTQAADDGADAHATKPKSTISRAGTTRPKPAAAVVVPSAVTRCRQCTDPGRARTAGAEPLRAVGAGQIHEGAGGARDGGGISQRAARLISRGEGSEKRRECKQSTRRAIRL